MMDLEKMREISSDILTLLIVAQSYADRLRVLIEDQRREIERNGWDLSTVNLDARVMLMSDVLDDLGEVVNKDLMRENAAYQGAERGEEELE